ncbi:recombinase family protein, partial [Escherichia coli]
MLIGYIRVSANEQNTALQRNALESAGCELIFEDKASGKKAERPECHLSKAFFNS